MRRLKDSAIVNQSFKDVFQKISYDIGIKEPLDLNDLDNIYTYIKRFNGLLSLKDVVDAFDMYSAQELEFKDSHFGSFNKVFVGKVLKSYAKKKEGEAVKPKLHQPIPRVDSGFNEKKAHYEWLLNDIYLNEKHEGIGKFPYVLLCNWKDVFEYMVSEQMIIEKSGVAFKKRMEEVKLFAQIEDKNPKKNISAASIVRINSGSKPMIYYRFEVTEYFKENREQIMF